MLLITSMKGEELRHYGLNSAKHLKTFFTLDISLMSSQFESCINCLILRVISLVLTRAKPLLNLICCKNWVPLDAIHGCTCKIIVNGPLTLKIFVQHDKATHLAQCNLPPRLQCWPALHKFVFQQTVWRLEHIRFHCVWETDRK